MEFVLNSAQLLTFLYYFCTILTILFYFFLKVDRYVFLYSHNNTDTIVQVSRTISKKTTYPIPSIFYSCLKNGSDLRWCSS